MKKLSIINENIFDGIGRRSKGGVIRKEDEPEKVDLGLPSGTIWAAWNVGASSKEEYGNYYAWGETKPKDKYTWNTYKFGTKDNLTKYNKKDGKTILDPEDDVAHIVLGGKWHMPTEEQIQELLDNTTNENIELNGVKGRLYTSIINKKELFFPYTRRNGDNSIYGSREYYCWSSSLLTNYNSSAMTFFCNEEFYEYDGEEIIPYQDEDGHKIYPDQPGIEYIDRYYGFSVRGVFEKNK